MKSKVVLCNQIISNEQQNFFQAFLIFSYRRDQNIRDILVHTSMKSQSGSPAAHSLVAPPDVVRAFMNQPLPSSMDHDTTSP